MAKKRHWFVVLALLTVVALMLGAGAVGASLAGDDADGATGGYRGIPRVTRVVYNDGNPQTSSTTMTDVPGMTINHYVASGVDDVLLINVSAYTKCTDANGPVDAWCEIRVLVDGVEANPAARTIFDSAPANGNDTNAWEAHSFQFVTKRVTTGWHTIQLQYLVDDSPATFYMDNITMSVQAARTY